MLLRTVGETCTSFLFSPSYELHFPDLCIKKMVLWVIIVLAGVTITLSLLWIISLHACCYLYYAQVTTRFTLKKVLVQISYIDTVFVVNFHLSLT